MKFFVCALIIISLTVTGIEFTSEQIRLKQGFELQHIWTNFYLPIARTFFLSPNYNDCRTADSNYIQARWHSTKTSGAHRGSLVLRYFRTTWYPIPIALGLAFFAYHRYHNRKEKITKEEINLQQSFVTDIEVSLLKILPCRIWSRIWGLMNSAYLPTWMRKPVIGTYCRLFDCSLEEAFIEDIRSYKNLAQFFRRDLKPGIRPIDQAVVVSPTDGTILHHGKVEEDMLEQVKGVKYSLRSFLGPQSWKEAIDVQAANYRENLHKRNLSSNETGKQSNSLFYAIIYLAPGDYHKFHSPTEWTINFRRHFSGKLLSVRPSFVSWFPSIFAINERVTYIGEWLHGFFSFTAVGATNVGSIKVFCDKDLVTNKSFHKYGAFKDKKFDNDLKFDKGELFGEFNFGSTVVLVFEAPSDFQFKVKSGEKIKYGQSLC